MTLLSRNDGERARASFVDSTRENRRQEEFNNRNS